MSKPLPLLWP
jgi:hypothetical protein